MWTPKDESATTKINGKNWAASHKKFPNVMAANVLFDVMQHPQKVVFN